MTALLAACLAAPAGAVSAQEIAPVTSTCERPATLVYVGDHDFPPYESLDAAGNPTGFNVEVAQALARQLGVSIEIRLLPWAEVRRALDDNRAHLFSLAYSEARAAQFDFLAPVTTLRSALILKSGRPSYPRGFDDLAGLSVAVEQGALSQRSLASVSADRRPRVIVTPTHRTSVAMLLSGDVDAVAGAGATLRWMAAEAGMRNIVEVPTGSRSYMIGTRKGCAAAMADVSAGIDALKRSGAIDQIAERTLIVHDPQNVNWRLVGLAGGVVGAILALALTWIWTLRRTVKSRTMALSEAFTEQQRLTDIFTSNEGRLAFAMDVIGEGVWEWDLTTGRIQSSTRWVGSFGYRQDEVPSTQETWMAYVHPEDRERVTNAVQAHMEGRAPRFEATYRIPLKGGDWIWVLDRGRIVMRDDAGRPTRMVGTLRDITVQLAAERALLDARDAAEETSRAKSAFLATVSHEIRTPLNAIIGTAQLMESTRLDEDQRELVGVIDRAGNSLLAIVNDVLDFTKIEAGRVELDQRPFDLRLAVDHVVRLVERGARAKGLAFQTLVDDAVPLWLLGDDTRLQQILLNLLSNAVKFTSAGSVTLAVSVDEAWADHAHLRFAVTDTGIGVPSDRLDRLFQPFLQVDSSTTRRFGGTGLGLAISRRLAELMGGTMIVNTEAGQGSTFTLTVGFLRAEAPKTVPMTEALPVDEPSTLRVILAEDNPVNQLVQRRMLGQLGYGCDVVNNGRDLVDALDAAPYDVAFVDIQMPEMDGLQASRLIRARGHRLTLIALTADVTTETRDACTEAGMDEYLSKPVTVAALSASLSRAKARARAAALPLDLPAV